MLTRPIVPTETIACWTHEPEFAKRLVIRITKPSGLRIALGNKEGVYNLLVNSDKYSTPFFQIYSNQQTPVGDFIVPVDRYLPEDAPMELSVDDRVVATGSFNLKQLAESDPSCLDLSSEKEPIPENYPYAIPMAVPLYSTSLGANVRVAIGVANASFFVVSHEVIRYADFGMNTEPLQESVSNNSRVGSARSKTPTERSTTPMIAEEMSSEVTLPTFSSTDISQKPQRHKSPPHKSPEPQKVRARIPSATKHHKERARVESPKSKLSSSSSQQQILKENSIIHGGSVGKEVEEVEGVDSSTKPNQQQQQKPGSSGSDMSSTVVKRPMSSRSVGISPVLWDEDLWRSSSPLEKGEEPKSEVEQLKYKMEEQRQTMSHALRAMEAELRAMHQKQEQCEKCSGRTRGPGNMSSDARLGRLSHHSRTTFSRNTTNIQGTPVPPVRYATSETIVRERTDDSMVTLPAIYMPSPLGHAYTSKAGSYFHPLNHAGRRVTQPPSVFALQVPEDEVVQLQTPSTVNLYSLAVRQTETVASDQRLHWNAKLVPK